MLYIQASYFPIPTTITPVPPIFSLAEQIFFRSCAPTPPPKQEVSGYAIKLNGSLCIFLFGSILEIVYIADMMLGGDHNPLRDMGVRFVPICPSCIFADLQYCMLAVSYPTVVPELTLIYLMCLMVAHCYS